MPVPTMGETSIPALPADQLPTLPAELAGLQIVPQQDLAKGLVDYAYETRRMQWSADGKRLLLELRSGTLLFDGMAGRQIGRVDLPAADAFLLGCDAQLRAFFWMGKDAIGVCDAGGVSTWSQELPGRMTPAAGMPMPTMPPSGAMSPSGQLVAWSDRKTVQVRKLRDATQVEIADTGVTLCSFLDEQRLVLLMDRGNGRIDMRIRDLANGQEVVRMDSPPPPPETGPRTFGAFMFGVKEPQFSISPDRTAIAWVGANGTLGPVRKLSLQHIGLSHARLPS
jgi:hypothetical protein